MHNLQGIISRSVNNANVQFEKLGYVTTDVANYATNGYKSVRFENYMKENGRLDGVTRTDFSEGVLYNTGNPYDVGLNGAGFIPVTGKDGQVSYTRDGSFALDKDGFLVTQDGSIVGDGIQIPANYERLIIKKDGSIVTLSTDKKSEQYIGKIPVVNFRNPEGLELTDGNKLIQTEESGEPLLIKDHDYIVQNHVEKSNVNLHASINHVLKLNASMMASTKLISVVDEMYRQSINLRQ